MSKKLRKNKKLKSNFITEFNDGILSSFYKNVEKLHAEARRLELGKYSPLVIAVESLKQKVLDFKERPGIKTVKQK
jgi:hypothetical protein